MTREEMLALMKSSCSKDEWNQNCRKVKEACDDNRAIWYPLISSVLDETCEKMTGTNPSLGPYLPRFQ